MIKVRTFLIDEHEEANKFMEMHKPRSTAQSSGLIFHEGRICIVYEDNHTPTNNIIDRLENLLQEERDNLVNNRIVLELNETGLKKFAPPGFDFKLSDTKIKALIEQTNPTLTYNEVKMIMERLAAYGNQVLKSRFSIEQIEQSIETYEGMLAAERTMKVDKKVKK